MKMPNDISGHMTRVPFLLSSILFFQRFFSAKYLGFKPTGARDQHGGQDTDTLA
jgi:hypothetical protein